ncbi:MAG: hypothetical protein HY035_09850 [Nitrospirae bacterium]|nr:hypothetical protein [Nitrospirota bacterium]MBI3378681.1 hypothetical protein [Nitrospirota bacterium]
MSKEEALKTELIQSIINYVRANHADAIDKAYAYFWDDKNPDEFLSGNALYIGFVNFEDWLIFDYKANNNGETFIDLYRKNAAGLKDGELTLLNKIKGSLLSLYEAVSVSKDKRVLLKDLLMGVEVSLKEKALTKGLKKGDIFAARLLSLDKGHVMSGSVYPFRAEDKKTVLEYVNRMFRRYTKNENPNGTMKDFLRDYGDVFNMAWMNLILKSD